MNDVQINVFHFILVASHWYQRLKLNFHRKRVNMIILCPLSFKNPPLHRYLATRAYQVRTHPSANITFARVALVPRYGSLGRQRHCKLAVVAVVYRASVTTSCVVRNNDGGDRVISAAARGKSIAALCSDYGRQRRRRRRRLLVAKYTRTPPSQTAERLANIILRCTSWGLCGGDDFSSGGSRIHYNIQAIPSPAKMSLKCPSLHRNNIIVHAYYALLVVHLFSTYLQVIDGS